MVSRTVAALVGSLVWTSALAHEIQVDPGNFTGRWYDSTQGFGTAQVGPGVLELDSGDHYIKVQNAYFGIHVDANGLVTAHNPVSATGGQNALGFNTVPITFQTNGYNLPWSVSERHTGPATEWLVPGTEYFYSWTVTHGSANVAAYFVVQDDGTPALSGTDHGTFDVVDGEISINTRDLFLDPGDYAGTMYLHPVANLAGPTVITLPVGISWPVRFSGSQEFVEFEIAPDGTVSTSRPTSATGGQDTLVVGNTTVHFEVGDFAGYWGATRFEHGEDWWAPGSRTYTLVPDLTYSLSIPGTGGRTHFSLDASGQIDDVDRPDAYTASGATLAFNTVPVVVDDGGFSGTYSVWWSTLKGLSGTNTVHLVPDHEYRLTTKGTYLAHLYVNGTGGVSAVNGYTTITGGQGTLSFNTETVHVDPGDYAGYWLAGILATPPYSETFYGAQELTLVSGMDTVFDIHGSATPVSVYSPCAVTPDQFTLYTSTGAPADIAVGCDIAPSDRDADGVPDEADNCPDVANADQIDLDGDGLGDACDDDVDNDTVANPSDNCPELYNIDQSDLDGDGAGDVCDSDVDGDDVPDESDNCVSVSNTGQGDSDGDGTGDACDDDDDDDGVLDEADNCQVVANADQADFDGDGEGDSCDGDRDGDGVANEGDLCGDSPADQAISGEGCTGSQHIAKECDPADFGNHGRYVSCVSHATQDAIELGLIPVTEHGRHVRQAARP